MPISSSDILLKLSTTAGSAGNTTAQGNPNASLGKYVSTTEWVDDTLNGLFDDITGDENADETVDYRCVFIQNAHGSLTAIAAKVWIDAQNEDGADIAIGVDTTAASAAGASPAQALTIANETTAPAGVTFTAPDNKADGLSLGDLAAGQVRAVWVRRTATDSAPVDDDDFVLGVACDTGE